MNSEVKSRYFVTSHLCTVKLSSVDVQQLPTKLHFSPFLFIFFIINPPEAPQAALLQPLCSVYLQQPISLVFMVFVPRRDWLVPGLVGTFHNDEGLRKVFGKTIFYLFDVFMVIVPVRYQPAAAARRNVCLNLIKGSWAVWGWEGFARRHTSWNDGRQASVSYKEAQIKWRLSKTHMNKSKRAFSYFSKWQIKASLKKIASVPQLSKQCVGF